MAMGEGWISGGRVQKDARLNACKIIIPTSVL